MVDELSPPTDALFDFKSEFQSISAGTLGGGRYGIKIRLPHAILMTMLFRRGLTAKQKLKMILKLTLDHSCSLAAFATVYKVRSFMRTLCDTFNSSLIRHSFSMLIYIRWRSVNYFISRPDRPSYIETCEY